MAVNVLTASGGKETGGLRDDLTTPPTNGNYGADLLMSNTNGMMAWTKGTISFATIIQTNRQFSVFMGLKLNSNPVVSETTCSAAAGYVEFADLQKGVTGSGANSPVYAGTLTRWPVTINSANTKGCNGTRGTPRVVTISSVALYLPVLLGGAEYTGTLTGLYEPNINTCAAGGIKLDVSQPGLLVNGVAAALGFNNGTVEKNVYLCFTSSNNYVYPTAPTGPGTLTGSIASN